MLPEQTPTPKELADAMAHASKLSDLRTYLFFEHKYAVQSLDAVKDQLAQLPLTTVQAVSIKKELTRSIRRITALCKQLAQLYSQADGMWKSALDRQDALQKIHRANWAAQNPELAEAEERAAVARALHQSADRRTLKARAIKRALSA